MGYFKNHLATMVMAVFAVILSLLWPYFNGFAPVLDFIFLMAVPIAWFMVVVLWLAQKSTDYMHQGHAPHPPAEDLPDVVREARDELAEDLEDLRKTVQLKDGQIEDLKRQIENLENRVQVESLKADLARLRAVATKQGN